MVPSSSRRSGFISQCSLGLWAWCITTVSFLVPAYAQHVAIGPEPSPGAVKEGEQYADLPREGLLSVAGSIGYGDLLLPARWGEGMKVPFTGSVSIFPKECTISMTNASQETYRVSVELVQITTKRQRSSRGSYSYLLPPGQTKGQAVPIKEGMAGCALILRSWKEVEKK